MQLNFITVDVFTDQQFGGNPLAVVLNGHGLTTEQMQSIAAEFNLAETTFVLPPKSPHHAAEVRIFTPRAELPFAGHPNVGTAFVLATLGNSYGNIISDPLIFEEKAGLVKLDLIRDGTSIIGARLACCATASHAQRRYCFGYSRDSVFNWRRRYRDSQSPSLHCLRWRFLCSHGIEVTFVFSGCTTAVRDIL